MKQQFAEEFGAITGQDQETALLYYDESRGDIQLACNTFFERAKRRERFGKQRDKGTSSAAAGVTHMPGSADRN